MKKTISLLLMALLLCGLLSVQLASAQEGWVETAPGEWLMVEKISEEPRALRQMRAVGTSADALRITGLVDWSFTAEGTPDFYYEEQYGESGATLFLCNYRYEGAGLLSGGTATFYKADGAIERILLHSMEHREDGGFTTETRAIDADGKELSVLTVDYDKEGAFVSGTLNDSVAGKTETLAEAPEEDLLHAQRLKEAP